MLWKNCLNERAICQGFIQIFKPLYPVLFHSEVVHNKPPILGELFFPKPDILYNFLDHRVALGMNLNYKMRILIKFTTKNYTLLLFKSLVNKSCMRLFMYIRQNKCRPTQKDTQLLSVAPFSFSHPIRLIQCQVGAKYASFKTPSVI